MVQRCGNGDDRSALGEERDDEVAEAVGVAEGDDGEVRIRRADTHAGADLAAVGEQGGVGEGQGAGQAGAAGGEFAERRDEV